MLRKTKLVSLLFVLLICQVWASERDKLPLGANWAFRTPQEMLDYLRTLRATPPSLQLHKESFEADLLNETKKAVGKMEVTITVLAAKKFEVGLPNFLQIMIEFGDVKKFSVGYTPAPRPGYKPTDVIPAKELRCSLASGLISVAYDDRSGWLLGPMKLHALDESREPAEWIELKPASKEQEGLSQIFGSAIRILVGAIPVVGTAVSVGEETKKNLDLWFGESDGNRPHLDENKYDIVSTPVFPYESRIDLTPYPSVTKIAVDLPIGFEQSTDLPLQCLIQVKLMGRRNWGFITPGPHDPAPTEIDIVKRLVVPVEVVPRSAVSVTEPSFQAKQPTNLEGDIITNSIGMRLKFIKPGSFLMGNTSSISERLEWPRHLVRLTRGFYFGVTEVTQAQWTQNMESRPWSDDQSVRKGGDYPAVYVSWDDAVEFCKKLSQKERRKYRLPTEAEWEYACRAGTKTAFSFGDDESKLGDYAWFGGTGRMKFIDRSKYAHLVAQKKPNPWGLFDMHGNVWEWCSDPYDPGQTDPASRGTNKIDPKGLSSGRHRILRGGSWRREARNCRSALHDWRLPEYRHNDVGFRIVLELK